MTEPIKVLLFGAGARGADSYGPYALQHPDELQFVAVAEPLAVRRERFAQAHHIPPERCFETWEAALQAGRIADVVFNCTQDQVHFASGMAALQAGYDMLLEKPICNTLADTVTMVKTAERLGRQLQICHVMRYTDYWNKVYEIVHSGELGQIITVSHRENVSSWHMAHSYVRGNWRNLEESAPMILAKCCHDLDMLHWLLGEPVASLGSTGNLRHYRPENAPGGAPLRCTDGCPVAGKCPFYAPAIYLDLLPFKYALSKSHSKLYRNIGKLALNHPDFLITLGKLIPALRSLTEYSGWPRSIITDNPGSNEAVVQALRTGPYGRCVYHCDNDVVDHQVVAMTFESGISATLTMHGHSYEEGRTIRIDGSQATLMGKFTFSEAWLDIMDHRGFRLEHIEFPVEIEGNAGHGGGDFGLMRQFVQTMRGNADALTDARHALESHLMAFAAEEARLENKVVDMQEFKRRAGV
jgi:predicted dehydrogenase